MKLRKRDANFWKFKIGFADKFTILYQLGDNGDVKRMISMERLSSILWEQQEKP